MLTLNSDFADELWEPPEAEFQPLLDFQNEILSAIPHNDISVLTQRIKRSFLDYVRQGIMLEAIRLYRLYKRSYRDFAEYCKLALGRSRRTARHRDFCPVAQAKASQISPASCNLGTS